MARRTRRRRRRSHTSKWKKILVPLGVLVAALAVAGGAAGTWAIDVYNSAPPLSSLQPVQKGRSSAIYAADGSLIGFIRSSNIRQPVSTEQLPDDLKEATVAIEDRGFFDHGAVDFEAIGRAALKNIEAGATVEGASTITQQLVRNLYIQHPEQTLKRKLIEAHLAYEEEEAHTKTWILTAYLNTAPYGTVEGQTAVGAEAAAQTYFAKPAKDLNLTEAALIAGLPQAPSEYNPFLDPRAAKERRNEVLDAMEEEGYIASSELQEARASGLGLHPGHKYRVIRDPFLFDLVQQELIDRYGINTVRNGGLKAYTTIDPELQERAQEAVEACGVCYPEGGPAAGLASVNPENGEIVALASTEGYATENQFNYAWQAHRQPGSSFKTFVLTTAIKQGIDPDSTYYDGTSPMTLQIPGGGPDWVVNNSEPGGGVMSLDEATVHSVNVIFAQLDLDVGPENVTETAEEMGIEAPLESVPAEGIGGLAYGVTPLEMADAYATLASGGIHHDSTAIGRVEFPDGDVDEADAQSGERVLTEGQAYEVTRILEGVITEGTGAGYTYMGCSAAAGKTGTSEGESDAWFAGFTPLYSTAVWVGHPQSRELTGFGGPTAGPIWASFMSSAVNGDCPEFEVPSSLPDLSGLKSEHTRSSTEVAPETEPAEEEDEGKNKKDEKKEEGGDEGGNEGGNAPAPAPSPTPAPTPTPTPAPAPAPSQGVGGGVAAPTG
jgi:penicillin-binding protein 1A